MLTFKLYNSVRGLWSTPRDDQSHRVIDEEEELDKIIASFSDEPPKAELELLENSPIVSENEGYKCQERMGFVTSISTNLGVIDDQFVFNLDDTTDSGLKVGSKVSYLAYRLGENEDWRVKNIITVYEENWNYEPGKEESISGDDAGDGADTVPIGVGEILSESAAFEKNVVTQVLRREGRIVVVDYNNLRVDLNTTSAAFTPFAGDWVALDTFVQVREDAADLSGDILEIVNIRPVRVRKVECVVTKWDPNSRTGTVDNNIFFQKEFCVPGFMPSRGDKVIVEAIESSYGNLKWRALSVEPQREFGRPSIDTDEVEFDELNDPNLYKDKNGVFVTKKLDFGTVDIDDRRVLELVIENGGSKPVRVKSIEILKSRSRQITLTEMPALPRDLNGGALMRVNISCLARYPGFHTEVVVVEFEGFKIARRICCEVKPAVMEAALMLQAPEKKTRYNYTANRQECSRSQRRFLENEAKAVPGIPLSKSPAFVPFRIPSYFAPKYIWDILDASKYEIYQNILEVAPMFQHELSPDNYVKRFQFLLHLAEGDATLDLRRYDMNRVKFVPKGEYLALTVPGLAESRPSLLPGDRVEAYSVILGGNPFEGVIHKTLQSEVFLKFDPAFHSRYLGEDYSVKFVQSRGYWKKCHFGLHKVMQNLGTQWLFPTAVTEKQPQIEFEEVDDGIPPAVLPSSPKAPEPTPSTSDEDKLLITATSSEESRNFSRNDSSSSDEGYIRRTTPKTTPLSGLLSMMMIKEEKGGQKSPKERSSTSERSSSAVSDVDLSGSKGSDSDSGPRKSVRKSPRDKVLQAVQRFGTGGNTPVPNGQSTSNNQGSPSCPSPNGLAQNTSTSAQNTPMSTKHIPTRAEDGSVSDQNSPANYQSNNQNGIDTKNRGDEKSRRSVDRNGSKVRSLRWINKALNCRQKDAVRNVLRGEARPMPYIIFGPPGTGKTMTLVETILQIYMLIPDSRILIATPSNSSADLIAERLLLSKILRPGDMVRLIAYSRMDSEKLPPQLLPYCALVDINATASANSELIGNIPTVSAKAMGRHRITVGTCLTSGQLIFLDLPKDHFTHVIMDEAGQATEPEAMVALGFLSRNKGQAILAGDPLQLGPVVPAKIAEELGLGTSFLARLLKRFPYNRDPEGFPKTGGYDPRLVTRLIYNYRSLPSILKVCSDMFYDSELIPTIDEEKSTEAKILALLVNHLNKPIPHFGVVFEGVAGENRQEEDCPSWCNYEEAYAVAQYVSALTKHIQPEDIGVITPYRKQVQKLRQILEFFAVPVPKIATVEEFQGQERLVIIVSTVRSCRQILRVDQKHHLGFVSSPQRLNVAISRAKSLLIIIGDPHLLSYDTYWRTLLKYCCENGSYIGCNLPSCLRQIE